MILGGLEFTSVPVHYRNVLKHQIITIFTSTSIYTDNHTSIFTLKADCPRVFLLDDPLPHPARLLHLQDEDVAADADLDTGISISLARTLVLTSPGSRQSHLCTTSLFPSSEAFFRINSITCNSSGSNIIPMTDMQSRYTGISLVRKHLCSFQSFLRPSRRHVAKYIFCKQLDGCY